MGGLGSRAYVQYSTVDATRITNNNNNDNNNDNNNSLLRATEEYRDMPNGFAGLNAVIC